MTPFEHLRGIAVPLDRANVDTDALIPKQFIKSISRSGFGPHLFDEWRYLDVGHLGQEIASRRLNTGFVLNDVRYRGAQILLSGENFGCGSSREHAVWALRDYGFRALIAPSFADIFFGNCFKNGVLPIVLDASTVAQWMQQLAAAPGTALEIDLECQTVIGPDGSTKPFAIDPLRKHRLLTGLDDIGLTLRHADQIRQYEISRFKLEPWLDVDAAST